MQDRVQAGKIPANDHGGIWVSPMFCKKAIQGGLINIDTCDNLTHLPSSALNPRSFCFAGQGREVD
jgi:hypothetical protein